MSNDEYNTNLHIAQSIGQSQEMNHLLPEKWSDWQLDEIIGGRDPVTVYKAIRTDEAGTSYSAIKVLRIPEGGNKVKRIEEIKTMLSLKGHPNVVSIEDYATVNQNGFDYIFIRMELLTPLDQYVAANDFDETETIRVGSEICTALEYCEKKGILHLDIKPSNIFVTDEGHYKLGDFGISRSIDDLKTRPLKEYTPNFMGPELYHVLNERGESKNRPISSEIIASKYDQYSLGLVLYWIRNNRKPPFLPERIVTSQDRKKAFNLRMAGEPLPPLEGTSDHLAKIIYKATAYKPEDRFSGPTELKNALEKLLTGTKGIRPKKQYIIPIICVLVCAAVLLGYFVMNGRIDRWEKSSPSPSLSFSPTFSPLPVPDIAKADAYGVCGENLGWQIDGSILRIYGTGEMYDYNSATDKSPWNEYQSMISKVIVDDGITKIGSYAFFEFEELKEVELPHSLHRINEMAFGYCYKLPSLNIPEGVEHLEKSIVYRCPDLREIALPGSIKLIEGSFAGECENLTTITLGKDCTAYVVQNGVLFDSSMEELICHPAGLSDLFYIIPDNVKTIGVYAFSENKNLIEVTIPDGLVLVDNCAFFGCRNLRSIIIPDSVNTLGNYAFYNCEKLRSVQLPPNIGWIDQQAFYNCYSLQEINVPSKVTRIGTAVFGNCSSLQKIVLPASVTSISDSAFERCTNVVIYCESGSFAEQFAVEQSIPFVNDVPQQSSGNKPIPFSGKYPVGLDMSIDEFTTQSELLIQTAKSWTEETAPRSLDDFPLIPSPIFDVYNSISQCYSILSMDGSSYIWKTNIPTLLINNKPDSYNISMQYIDGDSYQYLPPLQIRDDTFSFTLPANISITDVESLIYDCSWYFPNGWSETLQISYDLKYGNITEDLFVGILFSYQNDYYIDYYPGFSVFERFSSGIISIDIGTFSGYMAERIWEIDYNTKSKDRIRMSK